MLTEKDYCDYDTCVALKELGYDELCEGYYHLTDDEDYNLHSFELCCGHDFQNSLNRWRVGAPMLYEAQKWLREAKHLFVEIQYRNYTWPYGYEIYNSNRERLDVVDGYKTYEEALSEGLRASIKILQHGNN